MKVGETQNNTSEDKKTERQETKEYRDWETDRKSVV